MRKSRRDNDLIAHVPLANRFGDDPFGYYKNHYAGYLRGELQTEDPSLYNRLRRDGLIKHVPIGIRHFRNPLEYYIKHYNGLTRGQLQALDQSLYTRLRKDGLLEDIPLATQLDKGQQ